MIKYLSPSLGATLLTVGFAAFQAGAALPPDFPAVTVTTYATNQVAPGYIFLTVTDNLVTNTGAVGYYSMILQNDGTVVWYQGSTNSVADLKVVSNGNLHNGQLYHILSWTGGGDENHNLLDESYNPLETITTGNGYLPEMHDIEVEPNGNALVLSYYQSYMDLSKVASGAYPNALVAGAAIQELDSSRNVIWQWRSWDHYSFPVYYGIPLALGQMKLVYNPVVDSFHVNALTLDNDGNLLISNFQVDVEKINRQTGAVMWRLGGWNNQFSFVGENPQVAMTHFSGHNLTRLANGNIMIFCNADQTATHTSKVYEYKLDEVNKVATLVWSYTPPTPYYSWHAGSAQRLPNGNTFIGWGGANILPGIGGTTNLQVPACTEVNAAGQIVYQLMFNNPMIGSYRAFRYPWPSSSLAVTADQFELATGNTYDFTGTGVSLDLNSGGGGYNMMEITRTPFAPVYPSFLTTAPRVLPVRVEISGGALNTLNASVHFDLGSFAFTNAPNLTVYYRSTPGAGIFMPQPTVNNLATATLDVTLSLSPQGTSFGEFIFGYPDLAQVALPPIINAVESYRGVQPVEVIAPLAATTGTVYRVNQTLPISLSWSPQGFAGSYHLQISTNADYSNPTVDVPSTTQANYVFSSATPLTAYYYRVNTSNDGGTGIWSAGAFATVPPAIQVTSPAGGEAWVRGKPYFIRFQDNVPGNVSISLYKGGTLLGPLSTSTAGSGGFKWTISPALTPGPDYTIQITSTTNSALTSTSAAPFSIVDLPQIASGSLTQLPNGNLQFGIIAPGAPTATVLGSTNLKTWQVLQTIPVSSGTALFTDTNAPIQAAGYYRIQVP